MLSLSTKEKNEREAGKRSNDESRIRCTANKDGKCGEGKKKESSNDDVVGDGGGVSNANSSRHAVKTYNLTCSDENVAQAVVE